MPAKQERQIQSSVQEDAPGVGNGNHSGILAWEIPWTEEPSGLQSIGLQKSQPQLSD